MRPSVEGRQGVLLFNVSPYALTPTGGLPAGTGDGDGEFTGEERPAAATRAANPFEFPALSATGRLAKLRLGPPVLVEMVGERLGNWNANGLNGLGTFPAAL